MIVNEILGFGSDVKKAQKERKRAFRKELAKIPKMSKMMRQQINAAVADYIDRNPDKEDKVPQMVTDMVKKAMDYKEFKLPDFTSDFEDKKALKQYVDAALEKKIEEKFYSADDKDTPKDNSPSVNEKMKDFLEDKGLVRGGMSHNVVGEFLVNNGYSEPEEWMKQAGIRPSGQKIMSREEWTRLKDYLKNNAGSLGTG